MSAVPPSIRPAIGASEDTAEGIIDLAEDIFVIHPKPGGMVDTHRKRRERDREAAKERAQEAERVEERGYQAVKVTPLSPEVFSSLTYTLQPNSKQQILPNSPYRYRATVLLVEPDLSNDVTAAIVAATPTTLIIPAGAVVTGFAVGFNTADANAVRVQLNTGTVNPNWEIPAGGTSLLENLPVPIQVTAASGFLSVAATATATGFATVFYTLFDSANVILAKDESTALGGSGFILPPNVPVDLRTRAQVVAFNPLSIAVQISVAAEIYAPE